VAYVRTVKTASGATAVQVVYSSRRGSRDIEHLGSAHDDVEVELLKAVARQRLAAGQGELDLGLEATEPAKRGRGGGPLPITSSRMGHLVEGLEHAYRVLGFEDATGSDEVFRQLAIARIIEPVSKLDSLRVLEEAGVAPPSYATLKRRLPTYAKETWRGKLSAACAAHARLGRASLMLTTCPRRTSRPPLTAPFRSRPAPTSSSAPIRCPTTFARPSKRSSAPPDYVM